MRKTTLFIALLGGAIALIGFVIFSGWRDEMDMLKAGVLAVAVLLYAYPRRESWRRTAEASQRAGGPVVDSPAKGTTE
jgi:predicted helicase